MKTSGEIRRIARDNDAVAGQAQTDLTTAFNVFAGDPSTTSISADLAGSTLTAGVYTFNDASAFQMEPASISRITPPFSRSLARIPPG